MTRLLVGCSTGHPTSLAQATLGVKDGQQRVCLHACYSLSLLHFYSLSRKVAGANVLTLQPQQIQMLVISHIADGYALALCLDKD